MPFTKLDNMPTKEQHMGQTNDTSNACGNHLQLLPAHGTGAALLLEWRSRHSPAPLSSHC